MDRETLAAYQAGAKSYARDWHDQPPPTDLHAFVRRYFRAGLTADIGCGSGREVAWLAANGYPAVGYDASEALLAEARARYPGLSFKLAALPALAGVDDGPFENVMCETVIMHLPSQEIAPAVRALRLLLKPDGVLYLSWRVTAGADQRDGNGRLYTAFDAGIVRDALAGMVLLLDEEQISVSSSRAIHRMVAANGHGA